MTIKYKQTRRSARSYLVNTLLRLLIKRQSKALSETQEQPIDIHSLRSYTHTLFDRWAVYPKETLVLEELFCEVPVQWIQHQSQETEKIALFIHGGGFFLEMPRFHGAFLARLINHCAMKAVMPFYRLAPEHPFPAAVDDIISVYRSLIHQGYNPDNITVIGDSAGGNLALVLLQQALKEGLPQPACAVLISPVTDLSNSAIDVDHPNIKKDPMFNQHTVDHVSKLLFSNQNNQPDDPRASPLRGDFTGLCPLLFFAGSSEILLDHSTLATEKAKSSGVKAECHVWPGMPHTFPLFPAWILPEAKHAIEDIGQFITRETHNDVTKLLEPERTFEYSL